MLWNFSEIGISCNLLAKHNMENSLFQSLWSKPLQRENLQNLKTWPWRSEKLSEKLAALNHFKSKCFFWVLRAPGPFFGLSPVQGETRSNTRPQKAVMTSWSSWSSWSSWWPGSFQCRIYVEWCFSWIRQDLSSDCALYAMSRLPNVRNIYRPESLQLLETNISHVLTCFLESS